MSQPRHTLLSLILVMHLSSLALSVQSDPAAWKQVERVGGPAPVAGEKRLALVVGNAAYTGDDVHPLLNSVNDADSIANALQKLGFAVTEVTNADRDQTRDAVDAFTDKISMSGNNVVALLYYSGHGMQVNGSNYLIPINFHSPPIVAGVPRHLEDYAYPMQMALDEMTSAQARVKIVVLDACRTNPYVIDPEHRGLGDKGLAAMAPKGMFVAYATGENESASDNTDGKNGLFTQELLKSISTPGLNIDEVFKQTQVAVNAASHGDQTPYVYEGLIGDDFYFAGKNLPSPATRGTSAADGVPADTSWIDDDFAKYVAALRTQPSVVFLRRYAPGRYNDWLKLANSGNAEAEFLVGRCSQEGTGAPLDPAAAIPWTTKSADQGNTYAMNNLGSCFDEGLGVAKDHQTAMDWFRKAADGGNFMAMANLGYDYSDANSPDHDDAEALTWYLKASDLGYPEAMRNIAIDYQTGRAVRQSTDTALSWYKKASDAGDSYSTGVLFAQQLVPAFKDYASPDATSASKAADVQTITSALPQFKSLDIVAADTVISNDDTISAMNTLKTGPATDPMLVAYRSLVDDYIRAYELASPTYRQTYADSFAQFTQHVLDKEYKEGKVDEITGFWKKCFDGLPITSMVGGEKDSLIHELGICASALYKTGYRDEGDSVTADAISLSDAILRDRPWDFYVKLETQSLCFNVASALTDIGYPNQAQTLLRRGWTIVAKEYGVEEKLTHYSTLPLKGVVPQDARPNDLAFFNMFGVGEHRSSPYRLERFTVPCAFDGTPSSFDVYVVSGPLGYSQLQDQFRWLSEYRGGTVNNVESQDFLRLSQIAVEHNIDFYDVCLTALATEDNPKRTAPIYDFRLRSIGPYDCSLSQYRGAVMLIAAAPDTTSDAQQYSGLQKLYDQYKDRGFRIVTIPTYSAGTRPRDDKKLKQTFDAKYSYDLLSSVALTGKNSPPLFKFLTDKATDPKYAGPISGNFDKFLIDRAGNLIARFPGREIPTSPDVINAVRAALAQESTDYTYLFMDDYSIILVQGKNTEGKTVYCYVRVPLSEIGKMHGILTKDAGFNPMQFGQVVASGYGSPTLAVRAELAKLYRMLDKPDDSLPGLKKPKKH